MRYVNFLLAVALAVLSVFIYQMKYETRGLEQKVTRLQKTIGQERDAIGILRAEWSHLNRPARVERLARKHLGLRPLDATQVADRDALASGRGRGSPRRGSAPRRTPAQPANNQPIAYVN